MYLVISLIIVTGINSILNLPILEDPVITNRQAIVITRYPGVSAEKIESLITEPIEKELAEVSEVKEITSNSRTGFSFINIALEDTVNDTDLVFSKLRDKLDNAKPKLPQDAFDPIFDDERGYAYTIITALKWTDETNVNERILGRLAKDLSDSLRKVSGTDIVRVFGAAEEEILVEVNKAKLDKYNTNINSIANALLAADTKKTAGQLYSYQNKLLDLQGELDSISRVKEVPVFSDSNNNQIRVTDLAKVYKSIKEPKDEISYRNDDKAIFIAIRVNADQRVERWSEKIYEKLDKFKNNFSKPIELEIIFDQNNYIKDRLSSLIGNLLIGAIAVIAILFITLGLEPAVIVSLSIPLTVLLTMFMLSLLGIPIHQMSVTGLIVALGLLVDNAIVIVDAIALEKKRSKPGENYILKPMTILWVPLLSSTLTTILAFAPIALLPGPAGEFVGAIAISVICSLISSYIISIILIPPIFIEINKLKLSRYSFKINLGTRFKKLKELFYKSLESSLKRPILSIALSSLIAILGFITVTQLPVQFFPPADRNQFHIELKLLTQTSIAETEKYTKLINKELEEYKKIKNIDWQIGKSIPSFYYNLIADRDLSPHYAQAMVTAKSIQDVKNLIPLLQNKLSEKFPEIKVQVNKLEQGPPFKAPIEIQVFGSDIEKLREVGERIRLKLSTVPEIIFSEASIQAGEKKIVFIPNEEKIKALGFDLNTVVNLVRSRFLGLEAGSVLEENESIPIRVRLSALERSKLSDLRTTNLSFDEKLNNIPLSSIGTFSLEPALENISRKNLKRYNLVQGYLEYGVLPATVFGKIKKIIECDQDLLPYGFELKYGGEEEERGEAVGGLTSKINILMTIMLSIVILSFSSIRLALIIFLVAGLSFGLAFLSLFTFNQNLGFTAIIASMGLLGIAINASIIILSLLKEEEKAKDGDIKSIQDIVMESSTHIVSTTLTTFVGFMPLLLSEGDFWDSFSIAIAGGIVLSTVISFYFSPALFLIFTKAKRFA
ncbi:MAG: efflux RND transporter permease subunit [Candidatus Caenarcaniphilales bacterium]|nr:efflux RND transporter permease subunit [Candidatus Caenarcaniphilales bacterium]